MTDALTIDRPIEGTISRYSNKKKIQQLGSEEFLTELDRLLSVPGVEAVQWDQYTPYFNDGDACEFSVGDVRVKLAERFGDEFGDFEDGYLSEYNLYEYGDVGEEPLRYIDKDGKLTNQYSYRDKITNNPAHSAWYNKRYSDSNKLFSVGGEDTRDIYAALSAFQSNFGAFEDVLLNNFGDPALVTATTEGFSVEYYDHD